MDPTEFSSSPSGSLTPTVFGQMAFVPHPLPPKLDLNLCANEIASATMALGELKGVSYKINNPLHVINPLQRREAIASSSIEGTYTTASELLLLESGFASGVADPDTREVQNYMRALQDGFELLSKIPVSSRLIRKLHAILLHGVKRSRGMYIVPGEFKRDQNFIGSRRNINEARFVPPPPNLTEDLMSDLEHFINSDEAQEMSPIVLNALIHYQFETIHPFPDGNGRVGRLLLPILLAAHDVMPLPLLYISPFIEKHKDEYNDLMLDVSRNGKWESWISFFACAVEATAYETIQKIDQIAALKTNYLERVQHARASGLLPKLLDLVFDTPIISIPHAKGYLNITYRAAKQNVDKLVKMEMLTSIPNSDRPKLFICPELFRIIFENDDLFRKGDERHETRQASLF